MPDILKDLDETIRIAEKATPGERLGFAGCLQVANENIVVSKTRLVGVNGPDCKTAPESPDSQFIAHAHPGRVIAMAKALKVAIGCIEGYRKFEEHYYREKHSGAQKALTQITAILEGEGE